MILTTTMTETEWIPTKWYKKI